MQVINRESEHPELIVRAMEPQVTHVNAVVALVAVPLLLLLVAAADVPTAATLLSHMSTCALSPSASCLTPRTS